MTYFPGILGDILSSIPSGANSATYVEYTDGEVMPIVVLGTVWLVAGGALEYGNQIIQNFADRDWIAGTNAQPAAVTNILRTPVTCVDVAVTDTSIFKGRVGYGRIY